jgi:hypothetical protein
MTLTELASKLQARGVRGQVRSHGSMMVSRTHNPLPDSENSFNVLLVHDKWYIQTWAPRAYEIPQSADIVECCVVCFWCSNSQMRRVAQDVVDRFELRLLEDDEMERLLSQDL